MLSERRRPQDHPGKTGRRAPGRARYCKAPPIRRLDGAEEEGRVLFARLKRILGPGRLRLRGPCGVNDAFLLAAAQNLRNLAKIFPAPVYLQKA